MITATIKKENKDNIITLHYIIKECGSVINSKIVCYHVINNKYGHKRYNVLPLIRIKTELIKLAKA